MSVVERVAGFKRQLEEVRNAPSLKADLILPKFPIRMAVTYHDGPGAQFWDADGQPLLVGLIREPDLAIQIEWLLNTLAKASHDEQP